MRARIPKRAAAPAAAASPPRPTGLDLAEELEALLFASSAPLSADRIAEVLGLPDRTAARNVADRLADRYACSRALQVLERADGYQLVTRPAAASVLRRMAEIAHPEQLTRGAIETLAIIAYKQPVARGDIEQLRGVDPDSALETLLERGVIRRAGRDLAPGSPFLYETTREFLLAFGLKSLRDLPKPPDAGASVTWRPGDPVPFAAPVPVAVPTAPSPAIDL